MTSPLRPNLERFDLIVQLRSLESIFSPYVVRVLALNDLARHGLYLDAASRTLSH